MSVLELQLRACRLEAEGVCSYELVAPAGEALPAFTAGAHIDVHLPGGLVRQYSLCNDPAERHRYRIAVLREPRSRGGSAAMHEQLRVGQRLRVGLPRNLFALAPGQAQPHSLLLAGGIGITPLLAMAQQLHREGRSFGLHYCGRSRSRLAFVDEMLASPWAAALQLHLDDGPEPQRLQAAPLLAAQPEGTQLYVCGPAGFMDHVLGTARELGWPEACLHREYFAAAPAPASTAAGEDRAFEITLARSGRVLGVGAGERVIDVLAAQGVQIPVSCEAGVCGTCLTRVLDGVPEHRDSFLTEAERAANDQFTPCCSRALSPRLLLDL
ncbi:MAG: oxidoreductase [Burkholderiaceae bacterium]|nr:oxidoreductase [Burkholderiaceae bacterium]